MSDEIAAFVRERNAMLLSGDLERLAAFHRKWNPDAPPMPPEIREIVLHKMRTAVTTLPQEVRDASKQWLLAHGYQDWS